MGAHESGNSSQDFLSGRSARNRRGSSAKQTQHPENLMKMKRNQILLLLAGVAVGYMAQNQIKKIPVVKDLPRF